MNDGMKNEKKIDFIICVNNELYLNECICYIEQLKIPIDFETEIIAIREAKSMAEGYNVAMHDSNAKYKVYLHQDVFILNKDFIYDILKIFSSDTTLGMLGVVGGVNIPANAVMWCAWNRGKTYVCDNKTGKLLDSHYEAEGAYSEVEAIDGMLMITQYDIEWREDLDLGWDFYDITQSLEFRRQGLKIGIPHQQTPWCIHDCGYSKLKGYDKARKRVLEEYTDYFKGAFIPRYNSEMDVLEDKLFQIVKKMLLARNIEYAEKVACSMKEEQVRNNELQYAKNIIEIVKQENEIHTINFLDNASTWEEIRDKYISLKFIVYYLEHDIKRYEAKSIVEMIRNGEISRIALNMVIGYTAVDIDKVQRELEKMLLDYEI